MVDIAVEQKEKALNPLRSQPDNFRWAILNTVLKRDDLIREIENGSETGTTIINLMSGMSLGESGSSNMLGKRYRCLVCGTEVLSTKAGAGRVSCCDQLMVLLEPRPIPSSD